MAGKFSWNHICVTYDEGYARVLGKLVFLGVTRVWRILDEDPSDEARLANYTRRLQDPPDNSEIAYVHVEDIRRVTRNYTASRTEVQLVDDERITFYDMPEDQHNELKQAIKDAYGA